jgi:hypothetical protein
VPTAAYGIGGFAVFAHASSSATVLYGASMLHENSIGMSTVRTIGTKSFAVS